MRVAVGVERGNGEHMIERRAEIDGMYYLVGGGIASLAAAAFLIRDGDVQGSRIRIFEETSRIGGSLDAAGDPETGYSMRGGRMLESKYVCTWDLFSSIPTLDDRTTVTEETMEWNRTMKTASKARLFRHGARVDAPQFGLSERHILSIERLLLEPEGMLGKDSIADQLDPSFFATDFWWMWCTTFAFQPWHSAIEFRRYLLRFMHMISGFNTLGGILRTVYNQYDSMVRPLRRWLKERGVQIERGSQVTDLHFCHDAEGYVVDSMTMERDGTRQEMQVLRCDKVIVTLGSMTEGSSLGSMEQAPELNDKRVGGAWRLWECLADQERKRFGRPSRFTDHVDESKWVSFTTTLRNPEFFRRVRDLTGNVPGEGGLITFPDSGWLASIVLPHQPHFVGQPKDVEVFWGYGLSVDRVGDYVKKPLSECTGREVMTEIMGHLGFDAEAQARILGSTICIPCMMPFITSQFLRREHGDRPQVVPEGSKNLAFVGQFCEMPDDVVFTVEYSVRSAQTAVYALLGLPRTPPPVYKGHHDPRILLNAFLTLHGRAVGKEHLVAGD
jgi:oleate hydratase